MASRGFNGSNGNGTLTRDIVLALIVGFLTGALAIPVVINLGIAIKIPLLLLPVIGAALFAAALLAACLVALRVPSFFEFTKFAVVGVLNSGVDFGILNSLMLITGIASGAGFRVQIDLGDPRRDQQLPLEQVLDVQGGEIFGRAAGAGFVHGSDADCGRRQRGGRRRDRERNRRTEWESARSYGQTSARYPAPA